MVYLQLLYSYLKIGFFGFGGGYAMLALIQNEIVVRHHWLTNSELTDIIAISQMTPGPIAINSATYVGYTVTGNIWGSLLATFAVSLPSLTIMLLITKFYMVLHNNRYVRDAMYGMLPMVVAMILAATLLLLTPDTFIDVYSWLILAAAFFASVKKMNPILVICLSGVSDTCFTDCSAVYGPVQSDRRQTGKYLNPLLTTSVFPTYPGVCNRRLSGEVLSGNRRNRAGWRRVGRFPLFIGFRRSQQAKSRTRPRYLLKFPVR